MPGCCVQYCSNSHKKGFRLFKNPANLGRRKMWLQLLQRKDELFFSNLKICEIHFSEPQFKNTIDGKKLLKFDAVPDLLQPQYKIPEKEFNLAAFTMMQCESDCTAKISTSK